MGMWHRVASTADIREGEACPVEPAGNQIALYRVRGEIYATDNVCTHEFAQLSQGFVEDGTVECPLHAAQFDIVTGRCLAGPATRNLRTYEVRIEGEDVYVYVPD